MHLETSVSCLLEAVIAASTQDEAFALWKSQWQSIYEEGSASHTLLQEVRPVFQLSPIIVLASFWVAMGRPVRLAYCLRLIAYQIHDTYFLVNMVDNDYIAGDMMHFIERLLA